MCDEGGSGTEMNTGFVCMIAAKGPWEEKDHVYVLYEEWSVECNYRSDIQSISLVQGVRLGDPLVVGAC